MSDATVRRVSIGQIHRMLDGLVQPDDLVVVEHLVRALLERQNGEPYVEPRCSHGVDGCRCNVPPRAA